MRLLKCQFLSEQLPCELETREIHIEWINTRLKEVLLFVYVEVLLLLSFICSPTALDRDEKLL